MRSVGGELLDKLAGPRTMLLATTNYQSALLLSPHKWRTLLQSGTDAHFKSRVKLQFK